MSLNRINPESIQPHLHSNSAHHLDNLRANKQFKRKIRSIIKEALVRRENPFYNLILRVIDYIREKFGSTTTLNKKLEQKISTYLPHDLEIKADMIRAISSSILLDPKSFEYSIGGSNFQIFTIEGSGFQFFTYEKKDTQHVRLKWHISQFEKDQEFQKNIQPLLQQLSDGNKSEIQTVIKNHLPISLQNDTELIETLTNFLISKSRASQETSVSEKSDSQRDYALDRLFKYAPFAALILTTIPDDIESIVTKRLPPSMAINHELVKSVTDYIKNNKDSLLDEILNAQLDKLLNLRKKRLASDDLFVQKDVSSVTKQAINEWLEDVIEYPLLRNTEFMQRLSSYIMANWEAIKLRIEAIEEKYSENTLDFYTYKMLKTPNLLEKFLAIMNYDEALIEKQSTDVKALVIRGYSYYDPPLVDKIVQYIIENKKVLKEKAQEIKILSFIEQVDFNVIKQINLRIQQEVEKIEYQRDRPQFLADIKGIFKDQQLPIQELDAITQYISENKEEVADLIGIRLKKGRRRSKR